MDERGYKRRVLLSYHASAQGIWILVGISPDVLAAPIHRRLWNHPIPVSFEQRQSTRSDRSKRGGAAPLTDEI